MMGQTDAGISGHYPTQANAVFKRLFQKIKQIIFILTAGPSRGWGRGLATLGPATFFLPRGAL